MLDKLERKLGRHAIPNLTLFLVAGQTAAWVLSKAKPQILEIMQLDPARIFAGEVWRLISFIFVPPSGSDWFGIGVIGDVFTVFGLLILFSFGRALDEHWGNFRYNVFVGVGWLAPLFTALVLYFLPGSSMVGVAFSGVGLMSINLMVFQAFAYLNPEYEILVMLILPVKIKWLARLSWLFVTLSLLGALVGLAFGMGPGPVLYVIAGTLNFFLFFTKDIYLRLRGVGRRQVRAQQIKASRTKVTHECATCGVNDVIAPDMQFRYCSKCSGSRAYCSDHLKAHEHVIE